MVIELNIVILLCVTGAVLLAAVFHSILFYYFRTRLISSYALYLWMVFIYAVFRLAYYYRDLPDLYFLIHPDEALQMLSFIFYVRFIGIALEINPRKERRPYLYVKATPYVIGAYIVINGILLWWQKQHEESGPNLVLLPYIFIRVYLLFIGFYFLSVVNKKRQETYFRLIFWGASCIIFFGLASTVYEYFGKIHHILSPLSVLFMGFFTDILFFSAAISNRLHRENMEKERVKRSLLQRDLPSFCLVFGDWTGAGTKTAINGGTEFHFRHPLNSPHIENMIIILSGNEERIKELLARADWQKINEGLSN